MLELLPVFTRKPLWGYRLAVSGMLGVTLLSFFVWQHHLFVSGINADLRPFYMLSTEIISIPTGFIFLCFMGTMWRARTTFTVPMLFCMAWAFNFLIGGLSGVFLSDTPSDTDTHGSFFVMAHFHYTIMGGLIFTFFAAHLLLGAEDARPALQRAAVQMALLADVRLVQLDLPAAVRAGHEGHAPARERIRAQPARAQRMGVDLGVRARVLDADLPLQHRLLADLRARARRVQSVGV